MSTAVAAPELVRASRSGSVARLHLVAAISGVAFGLTAPLTVVYATALGASGVVAGAAVSSISVVVVLIDIFGGRFTPRLEPRRFLAVALLVFGLGSLISGHAPNLGVMIGARCLQGVGAAIFQGVGPQLAVRLRGPGQEGRALGQFQAAWFAGIALGPVLGGAVVAAGMHGTHGTHLAGLRLAFDVCAAASLAGALVVIVLLPSLPTGLRPTIGLPRLSSMMRPRPLGALAVGTCGQAIRSCLSMTLLPLTASRQYGLTGLGLGGALSLLALSDVTSMHVGGRWADRVGRLPILLGALGIGVVAALLTAAGHAPVQFCLLCLILGIPVGVSWVVPAAMAVDLADSSETGLAAFRIAGDIGLGAGGIVAGTLLGYFGTRTALVVVGIGLVLPATIAALVRETRQRTAVPVQLGPTV